MIDRVVLVPIAQLDRRAIVAAHSAQRIDADERRAVHVATDVDRAMHLEVRWLGSPPEGMPLDVVNDIGGIALTVRATVMEWRRGGAHEIIVIIGQMAMPGIRRWALHDRTAASIRKSLWNIPGVSALVVPVAVSA